MPHCCPARACQEQIAYDLAFCRLRAQRRDEEAQAKAVEHADLLQQAIAGLEARGPHGKDPNHAASS